LIDAPGEKEAIELARDFDGFDTPWTGRIKPTLIVSGPFEAVSSEDGIVIAVAGERRVERKD